MDSERSKQAFARISFFWYLTTAVPQVQTVNRCGACVAEITPVFAPLDRMHELRIMLQHVVQGRQADPTRAASVHLKLLGSSIAPFWNNNH